MIWDIVILVRFSWEEGMVEGFESVRVALFAEGELVSIWQFEAGS